MTTLPSTIVEVKAKGFNTKYAIVDAGYYEGVNPYVLFKTGVPSLKGENQVQDI